MSNNGITLNTQVTEHSKIKGTILVISIMLMDIRVGSFVAVGDLIVSGVSLPETNQAITCILCFS